MIAIYINTDLTTFVNWLDHFSSYVPIGGIYDLLAEGTAYFGLSLPEPGEEHAYFPPGGAQYAQHALLLDFDKSEKAGDDIVEYVIMPLRSDRIEVIYPLKISARFCLESSAGDCTVLARNRGHRS